VEYPFLEAKCGILLEEIKYIESIFHKFFFFHDTFLNNKQLIFEINKLVVKVKNKNKNNIFLTKTKYNFFLTNKNI
jgi:hypothetical protein